MEVSNGNKLQRIISTTALANKLMSEFGLIEQGWKFEWSNKKTALGTCHHSKKTIEFSKHWLHITDDEIEDTIRHEIAHALVGYAHGHDYVWRRAAIECGAKPNRCAESTVVSNGNYNYTVTCQNPHCPSGGWQHGKHRIRDAYWSYYCKHCGGPITVIDLKTGDIYRTVPNAT